MQNKDLYLLGCLILKRYGACIEPICQKLFLLGCVEPDWNLVTYTRGSIKHRFLHGHNAENVQKHLTHMTERLMQTGVRTPLQWFYFGAALHYLADSFTFAHNRIFTGSIIEHRQYEKVLHTYFTEYLQTDCRYILGATVMLCSRLDIRWCANKIGERNYAWMNRKSCR